MKGDYNSKKRIAWFTLFTLILLLTISSALAFPDEILFTNNAAGSEMTFAGVNGGNNIAHAENITFNSSFLVDSVGFWVQNIGGTGTGMKVEVYQNNNCANNPECGTFLISRNITHANIAGSRYNNISIENLSVTAGTNYWFVFSTVFENETNGNYYTSHRFVTDVFGDGVLSERDGAWADNGARDLRLVWNLYNAPAAAAGDTINLSDPSPANGTYFPATTTTVSINVTANLSQQANATLWINGTVNQTLTGILNGTGVLIEFNLSYLSTDQLEQNYLINVRDINLSVNTTNRTFIVDNVIPSISTNLDANNTYHTFNMTLLLNVTDPFVSNYTIADRCGFTEINRSFTSPLTKTTGVNIQACQAGSNQTTNITACDRSNNCRANSYNWTSMARLDIMVISLIDGSVVNNFTLDRNGTEVGSTTAGIFHVDNLTLGTWNILVDPVGFTFATANITINSNITFYNFSVYTTNSINITVYDESNLSLIRNRTITFEFVSDVYAVNATTNHNGTLYVDLLTPSEYRVRAIEPEDYGTRYRYLILENGTNTNLLFFMLLNRTGTITTLHIFDEILNGVEGATVTAQRYYLDYLNGATNQYASVASCRTDFEGDCDMVLRHDPNGPFYKFLVESPLGTVKTITQGSTISTTTLNIQIQSAQAVAANFYTLTGITSTLDFNNNTNTFYLTYTDPQLRSSQVCLYVYRVTTAGDTTYNTTCTSDTSGTLFIQVANVSGHTYRADALVTFNPTLAFFTSLYHTFEEENISGRYGLYLNIILTLVLVFSATSSLAVALIITPIPTVLLSFINLIDFPIITAVIIWAIFIMIAVVLSKK